jgi:hypothetical protein
MGAILRSARVSGNHPDGVTRRRPGGADTATVPKSPKEDPLSNLVAIAYDDLD